MLSGSGPAETVGSARVAPGTWETNNRLFTSVVRAKMTYSTPDNQTPYSSLISTSTAPE